MPRLKKVWEHVEGVANLQDPRNKKYDRTMKVDMDENQDIYIRCDAPGVARVTHMLTLPELDDMVEKIHAFHAEVDDGTH